MKKKIFIIMSILILLMSFPVKAKANYNLVEDFYGVLSKEERKELESLAENISENHNVDVAIAVVNSLEGKTATEYADDYYDYNYFGRGDDHSGILLLLAMEYRDYAISTSGFGIEAFTDRGISYIEDRVLPKLGDDDYYEAFKAFLKLTDKFLIQAENTSPYDVGNMPKNSMTPMIILMIAFISGGISAIAGGIYVQYLKSAHKTKIRRTSANAYQSGIANIVNRNDAFMNSYITRRAHPQAPMPTFRGGSSTHVGSSGSFHGGSSGKF